MKIRIDNIELRVTDIGYHIIKWYPNEYYGAEDRMIKDGWEKVEYSNNEWAMKKDWSSIHASCFKNPESCYTIARLEYFSGEGCCELTTVGTRVLDLKKKDRKTFFKVYKLAERAIRELNRDIDDEY
jgi:hypothetical protein